MRMHYDEKADALYLRLDDSKVVESEEVKPGIVLDFNAEKQVAGIVRVLESRAARSQGRPEAAEVRSRSDSVGRGAPRGPRRRIFAR